MCQSFARCCLMNLSSSDLKNKSINLEFLQFSVHSCRFYFHHLDKAFHELKPQFFFWSVSFCSLWVWYSITANTKNKKAFIRHIFNTEFTTVHNEQATKQLWEVLLSESSRRDTAEIISRHIIMIHCVRYNKAKHCHFLKDWERKCEFYLVEFDFDKTHSGVWRGIWYLQVEYAWTCDLKLLIRDNTLLDKILKK